MISIQPTPMDLARQIAADPNERKLLEAIPVIRSAPRRRQPNWDSTRNKEMRRLLDQDRDMVAIPTAVLRVRDRSEYFVRQRERAVTILHPHFSDGAIAHFLGRCRSAVTHLRLYRK